MNVGRLVGGLVVILVLYAVITQPQGTAEMTRGGVSQLGVAADRVAVFVMALFGGSGRVVPAGAVETGDGSSVPE